MAKKSKSTRRSRAKKQEVTKKSTTKKTTTAAVTAESSDEPVVKAETQAPAKKPSVTKKSPAKKVDAPIQAAVEVETEEPERESAQSIVSPTRNRMLVSAFALGVIIIALIFGAGIIHQQNANKQANETVKSGQDSGDADQILQSGGKVCTNGNTQTDTTGSANPQSVGMALQSNPVNTIQTPQTVGDGTDVNTLQGASCF